MSNPSNKLVVSFEFPGAPTVVYVHVNRLVGVEPDPSTRSDCRMDPGLEAVLYEVEGLVMNSMYTRTEQYQFSAEIGLAFDRDDLCLEIAFALGKYYGVGESDIYIDHMIDKRTFSNNHISFN